MRILNTEIQDHEENTYYPHTSANLVFTSKGTTVEEELNNLIKKMTKLPTAILGVGTTLIEMSNILEIYSTTSAELIPFKYTVEYNGSYKVKCSLKCSVQASDMVNFPSKLPEIKFVVIRNKEIIYTSKSLTNYSTSYKNLIVDISDLKIGDIICVYAKAPTREYGGYARDFSVKCDLI